MTTPNDGAADQDLAVQYLLGELDPGAARAFERRLAEDAALAAAVRELRDALGMMPYASVTDPPPDLRAKIVQAAEVQAAEMQAADVAATGPRPKREARRVVWSRFAAAAAAAVALAFGVDAYRTRQELALQRELAATLLEPNIVRSFALAGTGTASGAFGQVALDLDSKRGAAVLKRLPSLPPGQIYRLWAQVGDKAVPCGDFKLDPAGLVQAQFVVPVETYTEPIGRLFVTVEASGTPTKPTGPTVMESV